MTMVIEFIRERRLNVYREHDRELLLEIKNGQWQLEKVLQLADALTATAKNEYINIKDMPTAPDFQKTHNLCIDTMKIYMKDYHDMCQSLMQAVPTDAIAN